MQRRIALAFTLLLLPCASAFAAQDRMDLPGRLARLADNPPPENAWISEWERSASAYQLAVIDPGFESLPEAVQLESIRGAAYHAYRARRFGTAWEMAARATEMPGRSARDLRLRIQAAVAIRSWDDAANTLELLLREYPGGASAIEPERFQRVMRAIYNGEKPRYFRVAEQLFQQGFRYYGVMEPDGLWVDLATHLLETGKVDEARRVANRVLHARSLIELRAENRTAALLDRHPFRDRFRDALRTHLAQARQLVAEHPHDGLLFGIYAQLLALGGLNREALDATAALLEDRERGDPNRPAFDDGSSAQWVHNERANALWRLKRRPEALDEMQRGSAALENGQTNTSQNLNLANLQCLAGKPQAARETLERTGGMSGYGLMVRWNVALCAAQALKDKPAEAEALRYLRAHGDDAPSILVDALLKAGDADGAAAALVRGLGSEEKRAGLLWDMQRIEPALLPTESDLQALQQWDQLLSRDDVREALESVGHVYRYDLQL